MEVDGNDPFGSFTSFNINGFPRERHVGQGGPPRRKQDPAIHHELRVSLEEVFHGSTKRMKISRKRLNPDGRTLRTEDKILTIEIKRGWKEGNVPAAHFHTIKQALVFQQQQQQQQKNKQIKAARTCDSRN